MFTTVDVLLPNRFTRKPQILSQPTVTMGTASSSTASVNLGSDCELSCDPCGKSQNYLPAAGYCSVCAEYLCGNCVSKHAGNHTILKGAGMPSIRKPVAATSGPSTNVATSSDICNTQDSEEFKFSRDILIKHTSDEEYCFISHIVSINTNILILVDGYNNSIKMADVTNDVIKSYVKFDTFPVSITVLPHQEVAVTFPYECLIRILTTTGGLSVKKSLKLGGMCVALKYFNDKLYVSYVYPVKFQILSLSGGVFKTVLPDKQFLEHCTEPRYIAVHPDETRLYVSYWKNHVVLCMDMTGSLLHVYKDEELEYPHDITFTPFGSLYLCNSEQDIVYKIGEDLTEPIAILGPQDWVVSPCALCFTGDKTMYISSRNKDQSYANYIKVYINN